MHQIIHLCDTVTGINIKNLYSIKCLTPRKKTEPLMNKTTALTFFHIHLFKLFEVEGNL